jgi:1-deoxy-D-xylulose-5-phosphate synthase
VINMRFVKPLDVQLLLEAAGKTSRLVTLEDNVVQGGFGSACLEALAAAGSKAQVLTLGLPDKFVEHGAPHLLYDAVGLSSPKVAARVAEWLGKKSSKHGEAVAA